MKHRAASTIHPDDLPDAAEFDRLARVLLGEMAQTDPGVAEQMITLGIEPESDEVGFKASDR